MKIMAPIEIIMTGEVLRKTSTVVILGSIEDVTVAIVMKASVGIMIGGLQIMDLVPVIIVTMVANAALTTDSVMTTTDLTTREEITTEAREISVEETMDPIIEITARITTEIAVTLI